MNMRERTDFPHLRPAQTILNLCLSVAISYCPSCNLTCIFSHLTNSRLMSPPTLNCCSVSGPKFFFSRYAVSRNLCLVGWSTTSLSGSVGEWSSLVANKPSRCTCAKSSSGRYLSNISFHPFVSVRFFGLVAELREYPATLIASDTLRWFSVTSLKATFCFTLVILAIQFQ